MRGRCVHAGHVRTRRARYQRDVGACGVDTEATPCREVAGSDSVRRRFTCRFQIPPHLRPAAPEPILGSRERSKQVPIRRPSDENTLSSWMRCVMRVSSFCVQGANFTDNYAVYTYRAAHLFYLNNIIELATAVQGAYPVRLIFFAACRKTRVADPIHTVDDM